jgi:hypothetical protein
VEQQAFLGNEFQINRCVVARTANINGGKTSACRHDKENGKKVGGEMSYIVRRVAVTGTLCGGVKTHDSSRWGHRDDAEAYAANGNGTRTRQLRYNDCRIEAIPRNLPPLRRTPRSSHQRAMRLWKSPTTARRPRVCETEVKWSLHLSVKRIRRLSSKPNSMRSSCSSSTSPSLGKKVDQQRLVGRIWLDKKYSGGPCWSAPWEWTPTGILLHGQSLRRHRHPVRTRRSLEGQTSRGM